MKTMSFFEEGFGSTGIGAEGTLKAVIIYDSFEWAIRGAALLEQVTPAADESVRWEIGPWRVDLLRKSGLAEQALGEAVGADLILVTLGRPKNAHEDVLEWLEKWSLQRNGDEAAVMLYCSSEAAGAGRLASELKWFTVRQGLNFLEGRAPRGVATTSADTPFQMEPGRLTFGMRPLMPVHWGINE